jgi:single-stranded-DNA-specific exonuclease
VKLPSRVWETAVIDKDKVSSLSRELRLSVPILSVLVARGLDQPDAIERFLNPRLSDLSDPFLIPDMQKAVERIWHAINQGQRIVVHGDFDADGITATALMVKVLTKLGAKVTPFLPHRINEGYGLTQKGLERCFVSCVPDLLITVDCGTSAPSALKFAASKGVDVVVTDHHAIAGPAGPAIAIVNPKLATDNRIESLAGVGVAFKLCHALVKKGIDDGKKCISSIDLREYLDIVAVGTVTDVVPLIGENRILVRHGLYRIQDTKCEGLNALIDVAGIKTAIESYHLGFIIGPRLNAAGRMNSADPALELLLTDDSQRAKDIAEHLDSLNRDRKHTEESIKNEAVAEIDGYFDQEKTFGIVTGRNGWHIGVIGIVAANICGMYKRPSVVVGFDANGMGRGSGRSIESMDIVKVLCDCSDLLVSFGGHKMAAGLSIEKKRFGEFKQRFNDLCRQSLYKKDMCSVQCVDAWINVREIDDRLFEVIQQLKPFGLGNPAPVWGSRNVSVVGMPKRVGKSHLKMTIVAGGTQMDAIGFDMGEREVPDGQMNIIYTLQENVYQERRNLQMNVKDFSPAGMDLNDTTC